VAVTIERGAPEPLYQQLAGILRDLIRAGDLPARTMIPSITRLAAEYELAEVTVRKALDVLKAEGLIVTVPGRGTFVRG
jgi:DNA-binding GntR family transcriptional regulator